ncbi:MAG: hypothetical protein H7293_19095 [Candidatus Saccharibacteria bacterium]|nr:hypothetical protein [Rhodoferax sp.]
MEAHSRAALERMRKKRALAPPPGTAPQKPTHELSLASYDMCSDVAAFFGALSKVQIKDFSLIDAEASKYEST